MPPRSHHASFAIRHSLTALLLTATLAHAAPTTQSAPQPILPLLEKSADAQLAAMKGKAPADWTAATFYVGLAALSHTSTNPTYAKAALDIAEKNKWAIHNAGKRRFFADDQALGQLYVDLADSSHTLDKLQPLIAEETALVAHLQTFNPEVANPDHSKNAENRTMQAIPWWWCDALFMNPPVLAHLSAVTHDPTYLDAMDHAYWQTYDRLYDKDEHLFYRDSRFIGQHSKNGKKIFWSRGDGWVMGGLCKILTTMPANYPSRDKYITLFKDMANKIVTLQNPDGLWSPSLLDPQDPTFTETSGSAFFTYAFAYGIHHHLLDRATFEPALHKGWDALVAHLRPDGQLGFVQPVGYQPESAQPITLNNTQYYGNGAFLLAGSELIALQNETAQQQVAPRRKPGAVTPSN
jgi:rhamnogalacturonyl hydrolase YesR